MELPLFCIKPLICYFKILYFNHLYAELFSEYIKFYSHFLPFFNLDIFHNFCKLYHLIMIIFLNCLKALNICNVCQLCSVKCMSKTKFIPSITFYMMRGDVFYQLTRFSADECENFRLFVCF